MNTLELSKIVGQVLYRYVNYFGNLALREYPVLRETREGKWVKNIVDGTEHWVSNHSRKRLAHPTKEEALVGFIKRTEWYIMLTKGNLDLAKEALNKARIKQAESNIDLEVK